MKIQRELRCNQCGRKLYVERGILKEDALIVKKEWGYFSKKDLEVHEIVICESCYDRLQNDFLIPVTVIKKKEVLS